MNFKKSITPALAAIAALTLSACFQHETTIRLNKDGSGTITEETRLSGQMLAMMAQFAAGLGGEDAQPNDPLKDMLSEDKAKERATQLGEGVAFEKIEPVTVGAAKGVRTTYRFADISKLQISTSDAMTQMATPQGMPEAAKPAADARKPMVFTYRNGVLKIRPNADMDADKTDKPRAEEMAEAAKGSNELDDPQAMAMMKQMFADMKISIKLVAEPGIDETNASHHDGDTITLMEMDMNKLMSDPDNLKKLASMDQQNPAAAMEAIKSIEGVKAEVKPEVTVKLK